MSIPHNTEYTPIEKWLKFINSDLADDQAKLFLETVIKKRLALFAEIIMEGYCPRKCLHCIYAPDYHVHNRNLNSVEFADVLEHLHKKFNFKRFIFSGRSYTATSISVIRDFKTHHPDVRLGIIGDGPNLADFIDRLDVFDWVDVSLDGWGEAHDRQRGEPGAFDSTLAVLRKVRGSDKVKRTSILSCLTTINQDSILEMIQKLNAEGFKNFFVSPVHISNLGRPEPVLRLKEKAFSDFVARFRKLGHRLSNAWLGLDMYDLYYCRALLRHAPEVLADMETRDFSLEAAATIGDTETHISYYPGSLNLAHEFIVNCDGRVILPTVMAGGAIPEDFSFGHAKAMDNVDTFMEKRAEFEAFNFFVKALVQEHRALKNTWWI